MKRIVRVEIRGYFEIDEKELREGYEAITFEEAIRNQEKYIRDGECPPFEMLSEDYPVHTRLFLLDEDAEVN